MQRPLVSLLVAFCVLLLSVPGLTQVSSAAPPGVPPAAPPSQANRAYEVAAVDFSPDGQLFAAGSADSRVFLWQTASGKLDKALTAHLGLPVTQIAFSPVGAIIASAGRDSVVRLWDTATGQEIRALRGHAQAVTALAFSPDGTTLVTGGEDTRVLVWDVATGRLRSVLAGHTDFVSAASISADGSKAATGSKDNRIKLWDLATGKETGTLLGHGDDVTDVALSPDGTSVASASADGTVRLWDVASKQQIRELRGATKRVETVAFSPDGATLATGGDDAQVTIWDISVGQKRKVLQGHTGSVKAVAFSRDGKNVVAGGADGHVIVWEEADGQTLYDIPAADPVEEPATLSSFGTTSADESDLSAAALTTSALAAEAGPGGPVLIVTSTTNLFGDYYAEILRNEGLNAFAVADIGTISAGTLAGYDVVLLAQMALNDAQVAMLSDWVNSGGNLIAMRPDKRLAGLMGLSDAATTVADGYLLIDTTKAPGAGLVGETIQFHGTADRYSLSGATSAATLYANASTPTGNPAVTINDVGANGGQAAAFAFDLARSVVYTRQGNVAWAGQERDGFPPRRSDDMYFGNANFDPRADWVDLNKVAIPQADEQQRLLANIILELNKDKKPLPRFWYLPRGLKAAVIMASDDHGQGGTAGRFDDFIAMSETGCSIDDWECIRATSYIYTTSLTNTQVQYYVSQGFEIGVHIDTNCADWTASQLASYYATQIAEVSTQLPGMPAPTTERTHCISWSDWVSQPKVQLDHGIRLDTNYYYWPPSWVLDRPGFFSGSGMPMRFADLDGSLIDVYQATTQLTDESGQSFPFSIDSLLDKALGPEGYYGVITVNAHTDSPNSDVADAIVASAAARNVPVISAQQMLTWLDGRNGSSFGSLTWSGNTLSFTVSPGAGARGLQAMLPATAAGGRIVGLTAGGNSVPYSIENIKGVEYAIFSASAGTYAATFGVDSTPPTVTSTSPANSATEVAQGTAVAATFSESVDPASVNASSFELRDAANVLVAATVGYDGATRAATLEPDGNLSAATVYTATVKGGAAGVRDLSGNALVSDVTWAFTTAAGPTCPCSIWDGATLPLTLSENDPNAVELGLKFRAEVDGFITGLRFYKGSQNTGTHTGSLWTSTGQLLARATFTNETASGWQQVAFAEPVPVTANTIYVASYHAPNGRYSVNENYFTSGISASPLYALADAEAGGNGVYAYNANPTFPSQSFRASNYWVDVVLGTAAPTDTTPPTVSQTSPAAGATGVGLTSAITATFSEALDPATVSTSTFQLLDGASAPVSATVTYNSTTRTATLQPDAALTPSTTYTALLAGGTTDPRVKDLAGNALAQNYTWSFTTAQGGVCDSPANPIVAENCLSGTDPSEWDISGSGDPTIQGYATDISVNMGQTVNFKIDTSAQNYRLDIYRLGYYGGDGARKVTTIAPSAPLPQNQPACLTDSATGMVDCGNWAVSASWNVPSNATSGIYFAHLVRADTGGSSHVVFIVRDDASTSDLLFQTSDTTWQAYNPYGGASLYWAADPNRDRANKVSYNRPFTTRDRSPEDWLFNAEYPMVRWLESNGYDVTYTTDVDSDRRGNLIRNHKVFLSVGHDEYWSGQQWRNVEDARNAGVHLAFFSGNEVFWKTRWEPSIDGAATPYRTLVCYKETHAGAKIDPEPNIWTGTWRDARSINPEYPTTSKPENALSGTIFMVNGVRDDAITVPADRGKLRFWRNTSIANLAPGASATLPEGTLGYEWDAELDNGFRPAGLLRLSDTTINLNGAYYLLDYGSTYGSGTANHALTLYRHASGALVFSAGSVQWPWGLDSNHDRGNEPADPRMQQATVNLFADMAVQPATLQSGLVPATASTDTAPPSSTITAPLAGSAVNAGTAITVTGTASDSGGIVGAVEVSTDGGATWHRATGTTSWTYEWIPSGSGSTTIRSRAVDDSANLESPSPGVTVGLGEPTCPCSIWGNPTPSVIADPDTVATELGLKFRAEVDGFITGLRFYKGSQNTGTHTGSLWSSTGQLLARATFANETASGWQQVAFAQPVPVTANTVYVASYHAPNGRYSVNEAYFTAGYSAAPLYALADGESGGNGVYAYNANPTFPTATYRSSNFWVDVVFDTATPSDITPPTVSQTRPAAGATAVGLTSAITATFSEALDPASVSTSTFQLLDSTSTPVGATVTYDNTTRTATLQPGAALAANTTYTALLKGAPNDPALKDPAGNVLAQDYSWTFSTGEAPDTVAPTVTIVSPVDGVTGVDVTTPVAATFDEALDPASVSSQTFQLRDQGGTLVASTVTYDTGNQRATIQPSAALGANTVYTATLVGGATEPRIKDLAGNALAQNYTWSFTTAAVVDTTPPTVTQTSPVDGATGVGLTPSITATFSEALDPLTVNTSTFLLVAPGGAAVAATVTYDNAALTAALQPAASLTPASVYTAVLKGGATDPRVKDTAGNALAADYSWTFTTASDNTPPAAPTGLVATATTSGIALEWADNGEADLAGYNVYRSGTSAGPFTKLNAALLTISAYDDANAPAGSISYYQVTAVDTNDNESQPATTEATRPATVTSFTLWPSSTVPSRVHDPDRVATELGVKFRAEVDGFITGLRFYKGSQNTGTHTGSLWSSTGQLLARATFANETASGWQQVAFAQPVPVTANTVYVASYHAPNGRYAVTERYFTTAGYTSSPLYALRDGESGSNGIYSYSANPTFPTATYRSSNYWVDVVFRPGS